MKYIKSDQYEEILVDFIKPLLGTWTRQRTTVQCASLRRGGNLVISADSMIYW